MSKNYYVLFICLFVNLLQAQVTQIFTDYNNFWSSSSTAINPSKPDLSHNVLAFKHNGTVYSTGVDNAKLTANGVAFSSTSFRALPINTVPLTGTASYFIGFGQLADGLHNAADNGPNNPFTAVTTGAQKAAFLTDGPHGLNLGTCLTNIPVGLLTFNLSTNGVTLSSVGDGVPDIFVSQIAQPTDTSDELYFVRADGVTQVGNKLVVNMNNNTSFPTVGNWMADFYNNNSTQTDVAFVNTERPFKFFAADLAQFGINSSNYMLARKLIYKPGGTSDPAFIAYNEPSIGVAQQLVINSQPTTSNCNGTMPSNFVVRLADAFEDGYVEQAGYVITATMHTGPGALLGTVTATTDATGTATFSNLNFEVGGDHVIRFSNSSLRAAISAVITGPDCTANTWTGNVNTAWNNTGNWSVATIPNANNNVTIPAGRPNYPVLTANAGAKNLTLGSGASVNLNGKLFTIKGNMSIEATSQVIASATGSELYMSGNALQVIPQGFISGDVHSFTVENQAGVALETPLRITNLLRVELGDLQTNDMITMACSFSPRRTALIGRVSGSITGNVTTEQCFPARRAFRLISPSVTTTSTIRQNWQENASAWNHDPNPGYGTHITGTGASGSNASTTDGTNGFDWQPSGASSMFTFSNSGQSWSGSGTTLTTLTAGSPLRLMIRGSRSTNVTSNSATPTDTKLRTTGTVAQGTIQVEGLSAAAGSYSFVGNPYHSVVDMAAVMSESYNLTNFYYIWDPKMGGANPVPGQPGGRGAYVAVNTTTGAKSNPSSEASQYLQPYQAFFVRTGTLSGTPALTFREDHKVNVTTPSNVFRTQATQYLSATLFYDDPTAGTDVSAVDGLRIDFSADGDNAVDDNDAPKLANLDENISRLQDGSYISLESRSVPVHGEELPLAVTQYRKQHYRFRFDLSDFDGTAIYLKDYYLNQQTLITSGNDVAFSVDPAISASTSADRFSLAFDVSNLGDAQQQLRKFTVYPNPVKGDKIFITADLTGGATVSISTLPGQVIQNIKAEFNPQGQLAMDVAHVPTGVYILKVKTAAGTVFSSKVIRE